MRKRIWREYNRKLVERGSITFLIDPKLFKKKRAKKKRGRPQEYSNELILMLLMVKVHYRLPYRMLEGFMNSLATLKKASWSIPNYTSICKRAGKLQKVLPRLSSARPTTIILDASGLKVAGEGEWKVKIHGRGRPRKWLKVHIAIDAATQEIVSEATTTNKVGDGSMTAPLLDKVHGRVETVLADGGYDGSSSREAIRRKKAKAVIPPPKNARLRGDPDRDDALRVIRGLGGDLDAKRLWGKLVGYNRRVLVESAFSRMKRLFGDRLFSKTIDRQKVEVSLRCYILNEMRRKVA